ADPKTRGVALATAAWLQGEAADRRGDSDHAAPLIARALRLVQPSAPGIKLQGDALLTSGSIHGSRSEVAEALADFQRAHRIFVTLGERRSQSISLISMAMLYVDAKDYATARRYLDEALEAYPADPKMALAIYNSRGIINQEQGLHVQANADFQRALGYARDVNSVDTQIKFLRNIARNQLYTGQVAQADRMIAAARALPASSRDNALQLDAVAAQAALQHGRIAEAERLIDRAFDGVDLTKTDLSLRDAHQTAVSVYQARHRDALALAHLQALKRLDDQATRLATQTSTALMAARFNSANQDAKIVQLRDAERLRQARAGPPRAPDAAARRHAVG
ncbi:MAG: tetratricopeptide repeat protein, partial [Sphingomonadales bacterium]